MADRVILYGAWLIYHVGFLLAWMNGFAFLPHAYWLGGLLTGICFVRIFADCGVVRFQDRENF